MNRTYELPSIPNSSNARRGGLILPRPFRVSSLVVRSPRSQSLEQIPGGSAAPSLTNLPDVDLLTVAVPDGAGFCQFRVIGSGECFASFAGVGAELCDQLINTAPDSKYTEKQQAGFSDSLFFLDRDSRELIDCLDVPQVTFKGLAWETWLNILWFRYE